MSEHKPLTDADLAEIRAANLTRYRLYEILGGDASAAVDIARLLGEVERLNRELAGQREAREAAWRNQRAVNHRLAEVLDALQAAMPDVPADLGLADRVRRLAAQRGDLWAEVERLPAALQDQQKASEAKIDELLGRAVRASGEWEDELAQAQAESLPALQADIADWADATFPSHYRDGVPNPGAPYKHLTVNDKGEVWELGRAIVDYTTDPMPEHRQQVATELADCLHLLASIAHLCGIDLLAATRAKLAENKARRWGKPDSDGVVEHVREESGQLPSPKGDGLSLPSAAIRCEPLWRQRAELRGPLTEPHPGSEPAEPGCRAGEC